MPAKAIIMFWKGSRSTLYLKAEKVHEFWILVDQDCSCLHHHCCFLCATAIARLLPCQRIVCSQLCKIAWSPQPSSSFARFADSDPGCVLLARVGVGRRSNYQIVNINLPKMSKACFPIVNVHKEIPNIKVSPHSCNYHTSTCG